MKTSVKSNSKSQPISYYLPRTQLRLRCKVSETIRIDQSGMHGFELSVSDISIESETVVDTTVEYRIEVQRDTIFHKRNISLEFTEAGTVSAATLSHKDRLGPLIMKALTFLPSIFIPFKPLMKLNKKARKRMKAIAGDETTKRLLNIRKDIESLQTKLYITAKEVKNSENELKLQQKSIETLREQIAALSEMYAILASTLTKEKLIEMVLLPVWKKSKHSKFFGEVEPINENSIYRWKWPVTLETFHSKPTLFVELSGVVPNYREAVSEHSQDLDLKTIYYRVPLQLRADAYIELNQGLKESIFSNRYFIFAHLGGTKSITGESDLLKSDDITLEYHPSTSGLKKVGRTSSGGLVETVLSTDSSFLELVSKEKEATSEFSNLKADSDLVQAKIENLKKKAEREALIEALKKLIKNSSGS